MTTALAAPDLPAWLGLVIGLVLLVGGAEALVRGASSIALALGMPPLVIGLTIVAFGTSAPELAVSVEGAATGAQGVALGNVVGSNVFNVLAVLGLSALMSGLVIKQRIVRIDVPLLVGVTIVVWLLAADGLLGRGEGVLLLAGIVVYTGWLYRAARRRERPEVEAEYAEAYGTDPAQGRRRWPLALVGVLGGLGVLVLGSRFLVSAATEIASGLGVSDLVIGLTVVAAGTSLPELATSVIAAVRGERDIAVGNVVGSNLFNLLAVLGAAVVVAPSGLDVPPAVLGIDLPIALLVTLVALPALATGLVLARWEGALLLAAYVGYAVLVVLTGSGHAQAGALRTGLFVGLSATGMLFVGVGLWRRVTTRGAGAVDPVDS
jgi:cation:H+ antiporter